MTSRPPKWTVRSSLVFTMAMFGEVAFTVQPRDGAEAVADIVRRKGLAEPVVCGIDTCGAVLLGD